MKAFDIAFKDMLRSFRSAFTLVMMFVAPLLITGLIYLAFGGAGSSEITISQIKLGIVNLDQPAAGIQINLGNELVKILTIDQLKNLLVITTETDEASARQSILDKKTSVALIIPANFTNTAFSQDATSNLLLIHDAASTLSPAIVKSIVDQYVNSFNGSKIAALVVSDLLTADGLPADGTTAGNVAREYAAWAVANTPDSSGALPFVTLSAPTVSAKPQTNMQVIAASIMAGMIIFFVFYTGALIAQSIIREQDDQTLARLMTTPTSVFSILVGKLIAAMLMIAVQITVLMVLSHFFFGIDWGNPLHIGLVCLALTFLASGFGLFLMSFVKNMRQTGIILGGVLTVLGMLGGLYTQGFTNLPKAFEIANLFTPHGWALKAFKIATGAVAGSLWIPLAVMFAIGVVSLAIGMLLFRRRFA
jgi:ABC-2 type transport system permease protein